MSVAVSRTGSLIRRISVAWRALDNEQRLAAIGASALFVTMLLPWYTKTDTLVVKTARGAVPRSTATTFSAFGAFSFVEAAVLLVSAGVLVMLFARAERRAFHLPGGDGTITVVAGAWAALLIFYRMIDKPTLHGNDVISATEGITWGIFIALLAALFLVYAGLRIRAAGRPEPPLLEDEEPERPDEAPTRAASPAGAARGYRRPSPAPSRLAAESRPEPPPARPRYPPAPPPADGRSRRRIVTREDAAQLSFEDPPMEDPFGGEPPTRRRRRR